MSTIAVTIDKENQTRTQGNVALGSTASTKTKSTYSSTTTKRGSLKDLNAMNSKAASAAAAKKETSSPWEQLTGRALVDLNPSPTKKPKTTVQVSATASAASTNSGVASTGSATLTSYLSGIHDKLSLRIKTIVQLKITNLQDPKKIEYVVLSGAQDMKKVHHLMAYITGCSNGFEYHTEGGTSSRGCRFQLQVPGYKACWVAEKASAKAAAEAGADAVVDNSIKIVQIFQGLNVTSGGGMLYDSDLAKTICRSPLALQFVTSSDERYGIQAMAICPQKAERCRSHPMPRIVTYKEGQRKSGFGLPLQQTKCVLQGDRQDPKVCYSGSMTNGQLNKIAFEACSRPLCDLNGDNVLRVGGGSSTCNFTHEALESAGPPSSMNSR